MPRNETMVYVKAINGNVIIKGQLLSEGKYRILPLTPEIQTYEKANRVKTFTDEQSMKNYKYMPLARKAEVSITALVGKEPQKPKFTEDSTEAHKEKLQKQHEREKRQWEEDNQNALITPSGDVTDKFLELEKNFALPKVTTEEDGAEETEESEDAETASKKGKGRKNK